MSVRLEKTDWREALARPRTAALLLVLVVLLVYLPGILNGGFHFDDGHHIRENPYVRDIGNVFRFHLNPALWSAEPGNAMYRPTLMVVHALDYAVWQALRGDGYWGSGWILTNTLFHALVVLLVWRVALRLGLSRTAAFLAALVMALHPVFSEVVNYASSRSESVAAALMLTALLAHLRGRAAPEGARAKWYAAAALVFAVSMTAKETPAGFCAAIGLLELLTGDAPLRARLRRGLLFGALYGGVLVVMLALRAHMIGHAVAPVAIVSAGAGADAQIGSGRSVLDNLFTQSRVVVLYYQFLLRPVRLSVDHDVAVVHAATPAVLAALALHLTILLGAAWAAVRRGARLIPLCVGWFWIFLAPSIAVPLNVVMNEHRLYLPGIAVALLAGAALARVGAVLRRTRGPVPAFAAVSLPLVLMAPLVVHRSLEWKDELTLWTAAVERSPRSARAHMHYGAVFHREANQSRKSLRLPLLDEAIRAYAVAEQLHPQWYDLQLNKGGVYLERGRVTRDPTDFETSLAAYTKCGDLIGPHMPRSRFLRAVVLAELSRYDEAIALLRGLAEEDDAVTTLYFEPLARTLRRKGDKEAAAIEMEKVIAIEEPEDRVDGLLALGWWYYEDGDKRKSEQYLIRAHEIAQRTGDFKPYLYIARFLRLEGQPGADEFEASARKLGWTAVDEEVEWVLGGRTPGAVTSTAGLAAYAHPIVPQPAAK